MSLSTLANVRPMSELELLGVEMHDAVQVFWRVFGERMAVSQPEAAECAQDIAANVAEYGIVTVGGMAAMEAHELEECITAGKGHAKWTRAVQRLLHGTNSLCPPTCWPPASAALVRQEDPLKPKQPHEARFPDEDLGHFLKMNGTLDQCIVPKERLVAAVRETKDYARNILSSNDTSAVLEVCWVYIVSTYGNARSSRTLFLHLIKQLDGRHFEGDIPTGLFAGCSGKCDWYEKFVNRWKRGRKPSQGVAIEPTIFAGMCDSAKKLVASGLAVTVKSEEDASPAPVAHEPPIATVTPSIATDAPAAPAPAPAPAPAQTAAEMRKSSIPEKRRALQDIATNISERARALPMPTSGGTPMPPGFGSRPAPLQVIPAAAPPAKATKAPAGKATKAPGKKPAAAKKPAGARGRAGGGRGRGNLCLRGRGSRGGRGSAELGRPVWVHGDDSSDGGATEVEGEEDEPACAPPPVPQVRAPKATKQSVAPKTAARFGRDASESEQDWSEADESDAGIEESDAGGDYIVQAILRHRGSGAKREFHVWWEGYGEDEATWEPMRNLADNILLEQYIKENEVLPHPRKAAKSAQDDRCGNWESLCDREGCRELCASRHDPVEQRTSPAPPAVSAIATTTRVTIAAGDVAWDGLPFATAEAMPATDVSHLPVVSLLSKRPRTEEAAQVTSSPEDAAQVKMLHLFGVVRRTDEKSETELRAAPLLDAEFTDTSVANGELVTVTAQAWDGSLLFYKLQIGTKFPAAHGWIKAAYVVQEKISRRKVM